MNMITTYQWVNNPYRTIESTYPNYDSWYAWYINDDDIFSWNNVRDSWIARSTPINVNNLDLMLFYKSMVMNERLLNTKGCTGITIMYIFVLEILYLSKILHLLHIMPDRYILGGKYYNWVHNMVEYSSRLREMYNILQTSIEMGKGDMFKPNTLHMDVMPIHIYKKATSLQFDVMDISDFRTPFNIYVSKFNLYDLNLNKINEYKKTIKNNIRSHIEGKVAMEHSYINNRIEMPENIPEGIKDRIHNYIDPRYVVMRDQALKSKPKPKSYSESYSDSELCDF
jgi:hypothetical protein